MNEQQLLELIAGELCLNTKEDAKDNAGYFSKSTYQSHNKTQENCFYVAYSGGVDSTALLSLMVKLREQFNFELIALHANHQLSPHSTDWEYHCQQVCDKLDVPLIACSLKLSATSEDSPRTARYHWFSETIKKGSVLLLSLIHI